MGDKKTPKAESKKLVKKPDYSTAVYRYIGCAEIFQNLMSDMEKLRGKLIPSAQSVAKIKEGDLKAVNAYLSFVRVMTPLIAIGHKIEESMSAATYTDSDVISKLAPFLEQHGWYKGELPPAEKSPSEAPVPAHLVKKHQPLGDPGVALKDLVEGTGQPVDPEDYE